MLDWIAEILDRLITDAEDLATARKLLVAAGGTGGVAATAWLELCRLVGEAADPVEAIRSLDAATGDEAGIALGALVIHCFAAVRIDYPAQPDAAAARSAVSARAQAAYPVIGDALEHEALDFAVRLAGETAVQLSRIAASRSPLVRVETGISLPSSLIAWDLYGDPARGAEIADRNRSGTPMILPVVLQALAR